MAILVGGHPELSTCEGCFPLGLKPSVKQPSQVDNSGCSPPKMAIIVYYPTKIGDRRRRDRYGSWIYNW